MACEDDVLELMDQLAERDREIASLKEYGREFFEANEAMGEEIVRLNRNLTNLQSKVNDKNWLILRMRYLMAASS